jgi:hypothetical protein
MIGKQAVSRLDKQLAEIEQRNAAAAVDAGEDKQTECYPLRWLTAMLESPFVPDLERGYAGSFGMSPTMRSLLWPAWQMLRVVSSVGHRQCQHLYRFAAGMNQAKKDWHADRAQSPENWKADLFPWTMLVLHELKATLAIDCPDFDAERKSVYDYDLKKWFDKSFGVAEARPVTHLISELPPYHRDFPRNPDHWPAGVIDQVAEALAASKSMKPATVPEFDWREVRNDQYLHPFPRDPDGSPTAAVLAGVAKLRSHELI